MEATTISITDNERAMLSICLNYDSREAQLSDNFSNGQVLHAHALMGSKQGGSGLIGSLVKKGLVLDPSIYGTDPNAGWGGQKGWAPEFNTVWMTELGVNVLFDIIEGV